jgi:hypothetical protein
VRSSSAKRQGRKREQQQEVLEDKVKDLDRDLAKVKVKDQDLAKDRDQDKDLVKDLAKVKDKDTPINNMLKDK